MSWKWTFLDEYRFKIQFIRNETKRRKKMESHVNSMRIQTWFWIRIRNSHHHISLGRFGLSIRILSPQYRTQHDMLARLVRLIALSALTAFVQLKRFLLMFDMYMEIIQNGFRSQRSSHIQNSLEYAPWPQKPHPLVSLLTRKMSCYSFWPVECCPMAKEPDNLKCFKSILHSCDKQAIASHTNDTWKWWQTTH